MKTRARSYGPWLDADEQITAEEGIASLIFERQEDKEQEGYEKYGEPLPLGEDDCAELGRVILRYVLAQFRPDLFVDDGDEPAA